MESINLERERGLLIDRKSRKLVELTTALAKHKDKNSMRARELVREAQEIVLWLYKYALPSVTPVRRIEQKHEKKVSVAKAK